MLGSLGHAGYDCIGCAEVTGSQMCFSYRKTDRFAASGQRFRRWITTRMGDFALPFLDHPIDQGSGDFPPPPGPNPWTNVTPLDRWPGSPGR